jgi:hypothetical protein
MPSGKADMKSTRLSILLICLVYVSCNSIRAPRGTVPRRIDIPHDAFGGWIGMQHSDSGLVQGELIAVGEDSIYVLADRQARAFPKAKIRTARLIIFRTTEGGYAAWTFFGSLFTLTNGYFLAVSLPATLIAGIATTSTEAQRINYIDFPVNKWEELGKFSRFPQGLPQDLDLSQLRARPNGKRRD